MSPDASSPDDDGDSQSIDSTAEVDDILRMLIGTALAEVFFHIIGPKHYLHPASIGLRAIAVIHEIRPDILDGRSIASLALQCDVTRACLSKLSVEFRDRVGTFRNPSISTRLRDLYSQRATAVHNGTHNTSPSTQRDNLTRLLSSSRKRKKQNVS